MFFFLGNGTLHKSIFVYHNYCDPRRRIKKSTHRRKQPIIPETCKPTDKLLSVKLASADSKHKIISSERNSKKNKKEKDFIQAKTIIRFFHHLLLLIHSFFTLFIWFEDFRQQLSIWLHQPFVTFSFIT